MRASCDIAELIKKFAALKKKIDELAEAAGRPEPNRLALVKGTERYVFIYDDAHRWDLLRLLGRYASNPDLSFTWCDAAVMSQEVHRTHKEMA